MQVSDCLVDPAQGWPSEADGWPPVAFIDLDTCSANALEAALPAYPVIGLGNAEHPLATALDAVVEPPVSAEMLLRQIERAPHAA